MFSRINKRIAITTLTAVVALVPATGIVMAQKKGATAAKKETVKKSATTTKKASVKKSGTSRKPAAAPKKESVNDVKKQQGAVQQEIASTRAKIKENEQAVKKGLADLNVLQGEIAEGKKKLDDASRQVNELTQKISTVEQDISKRRGGAPAPPGGISQGSEKDESEAQISLHIILHILIKKFQRGHAPNALSP